MLERSWPRAESLPLMVATGDRGRIARVIASPRVHTRLLLVDAWRLRPFSRRRSLSRDRDRLRLISSRGDACRIFLFYASMSWRNNFQLQVADRFRNVFYLLSMRIKNAMRRVGHSRRHAEYRPENPTPTCFRRIRFFAWHACALLCLICITRQKDWMAHTRQMFDSFHFRSSHRILPTCLLSPRRCQ